MELIGGLLLLIIGKGFRYRRHKRKTETGEEVTEVINATHTPCGTVILTSSIDAKALTTLLLCCCYTVKGFTGDNV